MPFRLETFAALRSRRDAVHAALQARHRRIGPSDEGVVAPPPPALELAYREPGTPLADPAPPDAEDHFARQLTTLLVMVGVEFVVISLIVAICLYF